MTIKNGSFDDNGANPGEADGWTFSDNCATELAAPACATAPFPNPDGTISGKIVAGFEMGVSDQSDREFTQDAGTYTRELQSDPFTPTGHRIVAEVAAGLALSGEAGVWAGSFAVQPVDSAGAPDGAEVPVGAAVTVEPGDATVTRVGLYAGTFHGRPVRLISRLSRTILVDDGPPPIAVAPTIYYSMDETSGVFVNLANPGTRDGSLGAGTVITRGVAGKVGSAVHSTAGTYDAVVRSIGFNVGANYTEATLSVWVKPSTIASAYIQGVHPTGHGRVIAAIAQGVGNTPRLNIMMKNGGLLCAVAIDGGGTTSFANAGAVLAVDVWTHALVTLATGGNIRLWVNGVMVHEHDGGAMNPFANHNVGFLGEGVNNTYDELGYFNGAVDEGAAWIGTVLSDVDIASVYASGLAGVPFTW